MGISKRGNMAWIIVGLGLLVVAFFILLAFLDRADILGLGKEEACEISVLTRATVPSAAKGEVPLKCPTRKICLNDNLFGGKCEQFVGDRVDDSVRLSGSVEEKANTIEDITAKEMYGCWRRMGEGKLDLYTNKNFANFFLPDWVNDFFQGDEENYPMCVICSRIALDHDFVYKDKSKPGNGFNEEFVSVSERVNLAEHLAESSVPGGEKTYLQAFTDKQVRVYPKEFKDELSKTVEGEGKAVDEVAILFMQVISDKDPQEYFDNEAAVEGAILTGFIIAGSAILMPGVGFVVGLGGTLVSMATVGGASGFFSAAQVREQKAVAGGYCGELQTTKELSGDDKLYGCSIVRPINYDNVAELNRLCQNPEALYG